MEAGKKEIITIIRYTNESKDLWDNFVAESRNGTFLFARDYMEYHRDRFCDYSLMFAKNGEITALLPAHISGTDLCSHCGLTYGGLVLSNKTTAKDVLNIFEQLFDYLRKHTNIETLLYRPTPHIYHKYPCEEDLYAMFRFNANLTERKISSVVWQRQPQPFYGRRKLTTACKSRMHIVEDSNFAAFWELLELRLREKYAAQPVHTLSEITQLHSYFPGNIKLIRVTDNDGNTLAGVVIYLTSTVAHAQYTATSNEGRRIGALDYLYEYLLHEKFADIEYFDFGTSVEDGGKILNTGLISQKEGFGSRAIVYDTYTIEIKKEDKND
ncbi:MAG: GNAT family N-acetyltransferase [Bacteroidaceae bacterium]|nr:GNAT family N-acetyltransferase [Bacteroidaceae bacterium]